MFLSTLALLVLANAPDQLIYYWTPEQIQHYCLEQQQHGHAACTLPTNVRVSIPAKSGHSCSDPYDDWPGKHFDCTGG